MRTACPEASRLKLADIDSGRMMVHIRQSKYNNGPEQVVEYLGRYTHKVAISNHRLLDVSEAGVRFRWRDYRDNLQKIMPLDGIEFLRRFCQHILPKGFVRIRHFGLLSTARRKQLRELQGAFGIMVIEKPIKKDWKQVCTEHLHYDPDLCPCCGKGKMVTIETFKAGRAPPVLHANIISAYKKGGTL